MISITQQGALPVMGFEKLTVGSAVKSLTASVYRVATGTGGGAEGAVGDRLTAKYAKISVESNPIRVRLDGTSPDSSTGDLYNPGDILYLQSQSQIVNFRAIRTGSDATIQVSYYGA